jgi:lysophospholipase L1-like esterase
MKILILAFALAASAFGQYNTPAQTTLQNPLDATKTQLVLASPTGISVGNILFIDREALQVTSLTGPNATATRGALSTRITAHNAAAAVVAAPPSSYVSVDQAGTCTAPTAAFVINPSTGNTSTCTSGNWVVTLYGASGSALSLTTTGATGAATLVAGVLNVPNYTASATTVFCSATGGASSTLVCAGSPAPTAYATGMIVTLTVDAATTAAVTLNINSLGAKNIFSGGSALNYATLVPGVTYMLAYGGTQFILPGPLTQTQFSILTGTIAGQLPKLRLALANTRAGVSDTKLMFIGDSTTAGYNGSVYNALLSYATHVYLPGTNTAQGLSMAGQNGLFSTQWTGTWNSGFGGSGFANLSSMQNVGTACETFTPGLGTFDSYSVYYPTDSSFGTFTAQALGGSVITINPGIGGHNFAFTTVTGTASASSTLQICGLTGAVLVSGAEPFLSTTKTVRLGVAGVGGVTTSNWVAGDANSSLNAIRVYAPAAGIISLGINDGGGSVSVASYIANMTTIITNVRVSGDAIIMTMPPSQSAPQSTFEAQYVPALYSLAASLGVPIIDIYGRFGGAWQTSLMADSLHPNAAGYMDWAALVSSSLDSFVGLAR